MAVGIANVVPAPCGCVDGYISIPTDFSGCPGIIRVVTHVFLTDGTKAAAAIDILAYRFAAAFRTNGNMGVSHDDTLILPAGYKVVGTAPDVGHYAGEHFHLRVAQDFSIGGIRGLAGSVPPHIAAAIYAIGHLIPAAFVRVAVQLDFYVGAAVIGHAAFIKRAGHIAVVAAADDVDIVSAVNFQMGGSGVVIGLVQFFISAAQPAVIGEPVPVQTP